MIGRGCGGKVVPAEHRDDASGFKIANDGKRNFAISRLIAPEVCQKFPYPPIRGRRECRAPDAPDSRACNGSGRTHTR